MVRVKICGVTSVEDAVICADEGADAIGINLIATSPRRVSEDEARAIADAVRGRLLVVGVVADRSAEEMLALRARLGLGCLQLHGDEPPEALAPLLPHAYKAIRVAGPGDVARAEAYGGEHVLLDGRAPGTGAGFDWALAAPLARRRKVTLAGGIRPENVAGAIARVHPWMVDVSSGVESGPRQKDPARVRAFVEAVRPHG